MQLSPQRGGAEPRWLMGDVVRQKSRHIQMCVYAWNNPSTIKRREVLRQSQTAKTPELLLMFGVIKSGPVLLELSCGLVREGSHLLVVRWNYNPERKRRGKPGKKGGREVLNSPASPAICLKRSSDMHRHKWYSCWTWIKTSRQHPTYNSATVAHTHF